MHLALFSDIHGNPLALDAVLADIEAQGGADIYWVLGDLVALGYDPAGVLERLHTLPNVHCTYGNTDGYLLRYSSQRDRYLIPGQHPLFKSPEEICAHPQYVRAAMEVAKSYAWTHGYLAARGWMEWLATLPLEVKITLPDGTCVLGVHAAPGVADGIDLHPGMEDAKIEPWLAGCDSNLVALDTAMPRWSV